MNPSSPGINPWIAWWLVIAASILLTILGTAYQIRRWKD